MDKHAANPEPNGHAGNRQEQSERQGVEPEQTPVRSVRIERIVVASLICVVGLVLILLASNHEIMPSQVMVEIFRGLGIATIAFGVTGYVHLEISANAISTQMKDLRESLLTQTTNLREQLVEQTAVSFDLIKHARDSGITSIYARRFDQEDQIACQPFHDRIMREFTTIQPEPGTVAEVLMLGISLRQFFGPIGEFHGIADTALKDLRLNFRILLLDPLCAQAGLRSERESDAPVQEGLTDRAEPGGEYEYTDVQSHLESVLFGDLQATTRTLREYVNHHAERVQARLYRTAPSCMLIFINDSVFLETYHYGRTGIGGLKGGKLPVLEFRSDTPQYKELKGHFDHVWYKARDQVLSQKVVDDINKRSRDPDIISKLTKEFYWVKPDSPAAAMPGSEPGAYEPGAPAATS